MWKKASVLFVLMICFLTSSVSADESWSRVASQIDSLFQKAVGAYEKGNKEGAKEFLNQAYFGPFESERMEQAIRLNISAKRAAEIEFEFSSLKKKIAKGEDPADIRQAVAGLSQMIKQDAKTLQGENQGGMGKGIYSFLIIVREGIEAILVIAAIVAYLVKSGNGHRIKEVYQSIFVAIVASLATAYLFHSILQGNGKAQEFMEGLIMIIATVLLFSMSYWMFSKVDTKRWKNYIEGKVQDSLSNGKRLTLWLAVFLAVYREGAETVLFYQALFNETQGGGQEIWLGMAAGSILLIILFYSIRFTSTRLPLKPFFLISGCLLYLLAFIFAGEGTKELQAGGFFSQSQIDGWPSISLLGIYPTWEGIALQSVLLLLAVCAGFHLFKQKKQSTKTI
ncbi:MAG TPA: FTR1 family protein [Bacillota bacterium]|nr:FTR1 family protein [Bacillota bacterium]